MGSTSFSEFRDDQKTVNIEDAGTKKYVNIPWVMVGFFHFFFYMFFFICVFKEKKGGNRDLSDSRPLLHDGTVCAHSWLAKSSRLMEKGEGALELFLMSLSCFPSHNTFNWINIQIY